MKLNYEQLALALCGIVALDAVMWVLLNFPILPRSVGLLLPGLVTLAYIAAGVAGVWLVRQKFSTSGVVDKVAWVLLAVLTVNYGIAGLAARNVLATLFSAVPFGLHMVYFLCAGAVAWLVYKHREVVLHGVFVQGQTQ